jgi:hypothetical protein
MKPDTRLTIITILIGCALVGFVAGLMLYPFAQSPRALLADDVLLEYGARDLGTGDTVIVQVYTDGTVIELRENATVTVLAASELSELDLAIQEKQYELDKRAFYRTLSNTRCIECVDEWLVIHKKDASTQIVDLNAPTALAKIKGNI